MIDDGPVPPRRAWAELNRNRLIGYVERNRLAAARPASSPTEETEIETMTCGKCGGTEKVAKITYVNAKTRKRTEVERCEGCLERGLRESKPQQVDEIMDFARRFLYS